MNAVLRAVASWAFVNAAVASQTSPLSALSASARELFDSANAFNDAYWDEQEGFLLATDSSGIHDVRATAMWVPSLLARNGSGDAARVARIVAAVAEEQYQDSARLWWGTYPHTPQEPVPGDFGGEAAYTDYDPNWRDFVGTAWCLALAQSEHLLPASTVKTVEDSLHLAARSLSKRYQGRGSYPNGADTNQSVDNLDQAYTNPWLMGTFLAGWIGNRLGDANLTAKSDEDAQAIYDLFAFNNYSTFSEYNTATYGGVDCWALALWIAYAPEGSKMQALGPKLAAALLRDIGDFYHAGLRNLAGPWDRTYGYDMTRYHSVLGYFITALAPSGSAATPLNPTAALHINDYAIYGHLGPLVAHILASYTPQSTAESFRGFNGTDRLLQRTVRTNTEDPTAIRNVTAWLSNGIAVGGQSLDEPTKRTEQFVAATVQWALPVSPLSQAATNPPREPRIGYIALSPPLWGTVDATAATGRLAVSFPPSRRWPQQTMPGLVTFQVGGFDLRTDLNDSGAATLKAQGLEGLTEVFPDLRRVATHGLGSPVVTFNSDGFHGFYPFNVSYPVNTSWPDVPSVTLEFA